MLKQILGVIAGLIAGVAGISLVQMVSHKMYPMPEGLSLDDSAGLIAHFDSLPVTAFLMVILSYIIGSFLGGLVATLMSKTKFMPAFIVGGVLAIMGVLNALAIPQPLWVSIAGVAVMLPMAWLGARMIKSV